MDKDTEKNQSGDEGESTKYVKRTSPDGKDRIIVPKNDKNSTSLWSSELEAEFEELLKEAELKKKLKDREKLSKVHKDTYDWILKDFSDSVNCGLLPTYDLKKAWLDDTRMNAVQKLNWENSHQHAIARGMIDAVEHLSGLAYKANIVNKKNQEFIQQNIKDSPQPKKPDSPRTLTGYMDQTKIEEWDTSVIPELLVRKYIRNDGKNKYKWSDERGMKGEVLKNFYIAVWDNFILKKYKKDHAAKIQKRFKEYFPLDSDKEYSALKGIKKEINRLTAEERRPIETQFPFMYKK